MPKGKAGGKAKKIRRVKAKAAARKRKDTPETIFETRPPPQYERPINREIPKKWQGWLKDNTTHGILNPGKLPH
tara:strand:+ start:10132 stop:10353 length:222 start_codon:yes stop_codon:yes gene_type:complete